MSNQSLIKKVYVAYELKTGEVFGPYRQLLADRIALVKTAKIRGWDDSDHTQNAFGVWVIAKRVGAYDKDFDTFLEEIADVTIYTPDEVGEIEDFFTRQQTESPSL